MKSWIQQILLILLLLLTGSAISPIPPGGDDNGKSNTCSTFLVINGESNINRFSFSFLSNPDDPADSYNSHTGDNGTEVLIPLREFQASNPRMYNDFLQEVHEREYPNISIFLPYMGPDKLEAMTTGAEQKVLITMAGVEKQYTVDCDLVNCGDRLVIRGSQMIRLTDFKISPPEKLNGLIKVKNEITVSFGIILNFIPRNTFADSR
jgi:hypothetical protein